MNFLYRSLTSLLLLAAGGVAAQAPAQLQPVQTIGLGEHGTVGAALSLPNHNLVLLLTDAVSPDITAQCLAPDGHTLWKTTLTRFQRSVEVGGGPSDLRHEPIAIGSGSMSKAKNLLKKEKTAALLAPVRVFTDGNEVLLVESLYEDNFKKEIKDGSMKVKNGQKLMQRLDEQGGLTKYLFEPQHRPESKIASAFLGDYVEANGYVVVVRETNVREASSTFTTVHYDLKTKAVRYEPLELPANPKPIGGLNRFRYWYQDWAYLGHRSNQTYFCRRTLVGSPTDIPGNHPITYQVHIADDLGAPAGGFSTTLGLNKGTRPVYSGLMTSPGALSHIENFYTQTKTKSMNGFAQPMGRTTFTTYDTWETSSGGIGSFYLDYHTGDVLIYGEYGEGELPDVAGSDLLGFFERRYAPDGRVLAQVQDPYSAAMREKKKNVIFKGDFFRRTHFSLDPLSGQSQFSFAPRNMFYTGYFDLFMDRNLKPLRYEYVPSKYKDERIFTTVLFAQPFKERTSFSNEDEGRHYENATKDDHPVYAALEKLRRTTGPDAPDYRFYLNLTGPATGLVVEHKLGIGGSLRVYQF